jgi:hypothetical protein
MGSCNSSRLANPEARSEPCDIDDGVGMQALDYSLTGYVDGAIDQKNSNNSEPFFLAGSLRVAHAL